MLVASVRRRSRRLPPAAGVVTVGSLWADEGVYYPLAVEPYTPAPWFAHGKADPAFRTKPQIALALVEQALGEAWPFRAVVADCLYGEDRGFTAGLQARGAPYVVALKPSHAWRARATEVGTVREVAARGGWVAAEQPGDWQPVIRHYRDGQQERWWALEGEAGPFGPAAARRLVVATTDPAILPDPATWYLATTLPVAEADLTEVVRLYGLRNWVEQAYKQVKQSLGWSQYQVRSDRAMRRHWALVQAAFAFCWWAESRTPGPAARDGPVPPPDPPSPEESRGTPLGEPGGKKARPSDPPWPRPWRCWPRALRRVRAWLEPAWFLWRCWRAWSDQPPPPALRALLDWLHHGHPLMLYDTS